MLNVLDTLGVSQSVLKVIDRRQRMDAIIVYGGMFVITFFIFVFWWFTRDEHTHVLERKIEKFLVYTSDVLAM